MRSIVTALASGAMLLAAAGFAQNASGGSAGNATPNPGRSHNAHMTLTTTAFADGGVIGDANSMKVGINAPTPDLTWSPPPLGTQSLALIMHDMDVVANLTDGTHWLIFNIPPTATSLPAGVPKVAQLPDGSVQPLNRRIHGYTPPGAPPGLYHHYVIEVYALDTKLPLDDTATRDAMLKAMDGHILDKAVLTGRFHM